MRKLERILLIAIVLTAIINLFGFPGTTLLMTISYCLLAFTYITIGIWSLGKLGIGLIVIKAPTTSEYASDNSIFPSIEPPANSMFNPIGWKQKLGLFFACYCFAAMTLAILFRMSYWAGSNILLVLGVLQSIVVLIPILIKQIRKPSLFYRQLLLRISIFLVVCILLLMLPRTFFIDIKYRDNPEKLQEITNYNPS